METKKKIRVTAAALIQRILCLATVPPDPDIIARVKESFPKSKFDGSQLSWYKSRYRQGLLSGMKKGTHVIAQKQAAKKSGKPATPKKAAKAGKVKPETPVVAFKPKKAVV